MRAILSKTSLDKIKSKILSQDISELVFEVYISPKEFASIIEQFHDQEIELSLKPND